MGYFEINCSGFNPCRSPKTLSWASAQKYKNLVLGISREVQRPGPGHQPRSTKTLSWTSAQKYKDPVLDTSPEVQRPGPGHQPRSTKTLSWTSAQKYKDLVLDISPEVQRPGPGYQLRGIKRCTMWATDHRDDVSWLDSSAAWAAALTDTWAPLGQLDAR